MATKKKSVGSHTGVRRDIRRALALSEQVSAALVDALVIVEGNAGEQLAEAVKALRMIANTRIEVKGSSGEHYQTRWMRGIAQGALHRMGVEASS